MKHGKLAVSSTVLVMALTLSSLGQSGGAFTIERSVVAAGGTTAGGAFTVQSAIGQPTSGNQQGGSFSIASGFFIPVFTPTSAGVSISGRLVTPDGLGVRNAIVLLTDSSGSNLVARSAAFGYFRFDDVEVGRTYILSIASKRYTFAPQVLTVNDELTGLEFIALGN